MSQQRYLKPNWLISRVINPLLMRIGAVPTLWVRGRKTGYWRSVPVNVLDLDGERYLVSPRGETDWVRNLRAAGGGQLQYGRRCTEAFTAVEMPDQVKPQVIEAYLHRWRSQVKSQFEALPDPANHPIFRIKSGQAKIYRVTPRTSAIRFKFVLALVRICLRRIGSVLAFFSWGMGRALVDHLTFLRIALKANLEGDACRSPEPHILCMTASINTPLGTPSGCCSKIRDSSSV